MTKNKPAEQGDSSDRHLRLPFKGGVKARQEPPVKCVRVKGFPGHIAHRDPHNWGVDREVAMKDG
jgi:hypothetical protein